MHAEKNKPDKILAEIYMLGQFSITVGDASISDSINRSRKLWSSLAYLVAHRGRLVTQKELIAQFWPTDNPVAAANALKTLFYRIRSLIAPIFPPGFSPIVSRRGGYLWNPEICTESDTTQFEALCTRAKDPQTGDDERIELYLKAFSLYKGRYLPNQRLGDWTVPIAAHYHALYISSVLHCAAILEDRGHYEEMTAVTRAAAEIDPYDETLATALISSLLRQDLNREALVHYEKVSELLYRTRDLRPSQALRDIYEKILESENNPKTDLSVIQSELEATAETTSAYFCEYGVFREIYRLEARRAARSGESIHIALVTIINDQGQIPELDSLGHTPDNVLKVLRSCLRRGDVVSKYSGAQFLLMLPQTSSDNCAKIIRRIDSAFRRQHRTTPFLLNCKIRELRPT